MNTVTPSTGAKKNEVYQVYWLASVLLEWHRQLNEVLTCMATCVLDGNKNANATRITGLTMKIFPFLFYGIFS